MLDLGEFNPVPHLGHVLLEKPSPVLQGSVHQALPVVKDAIKHE